jgi:pyrimidine operon attenuation protein / uracil phosphoribosyltransferase
MKWTATAGRVKGTVMDEDAIRRSLTRIAHEIVERNKGANDLVLVGIVRKGDTLAQRLAAHIADLEGSTVPVGRINPARHRDDLHIRPVADGSDISELPEIKDRIVVLVDDVIWHGRTIRAAMDALMELGRPRAIQLAVLVDRGHRELPIRPDYVGKNIATSPDEMVYVCLREFEDLDQVVIIK